MSCILKVLLFLLAVQQYAAVKTPLYDNFLTVQVPSVSDMYKLVRYSSSWTKVLLKFYGNDTSIDYTTYTWMEACYQEFYNARNASYVVFWLKDDVVSCEAVSPISFPKTPKFTIDYLMRVEEPGDRCTETM